MQFRLAHVELPKIRRRLQIAFWLALWLASVSGLILLYMTG